VVTTITRAPGLNKLRLWIFDNLVRPNQAAVVYVVAAALVLLSVLPIWAVQRLAGEETGGRL
jgi:putative spermidine/putrescine transport system permease protein